VKAIVLENDREKRRLRLGLKHLIPTSLDEYIGEHKAGDEVTGRVTEVNRNRATVELGEGVQGHCQLAVVEQKQEQKTGPVDLSALSSMLASKWKGAGAGSGSGASAASDGTPKSEQVRTGQVRSFRILKLDVEKKKIELELIS
jgi:small subunit ribosomal protein S1